MSVSTTARRDFLRRIISIALLIFTGRIASAHARLLRSQPKDGTSFTDSPKSVELWFNELLDDAFHAVHLYRSDERSGKKRDEVTIGKLEVDPKDRTHLLVKLPSLAPGSYLVEYRVLSRDGHTAPGNLSFSVAGSRVSEARR